MTTSRLTRRALRDGHVSAMIPLYAVESVASGWALMGVTWNNAGRVIRVYAKKNANPSSSSSSSVGEWMTEGGMGRELLRFDPLSRGRGDFETNEDVGCSWIGIKGKWLGTSWTEGRSSRPSRPLRGASSCREGGTGNTS